jgi:hypothetical protein
MSRTTVPGFQSEEILLTAQTDTATTGDLTNLCNKGIHVLLRISAIATATCVLKVEGKDPASGEYYTLLESAALNSTGVKELLIFPGATATANVSANVFLPPIFKITNTVTLGGGTIAYTLGAAFLA